MIAIARKGPFWYITLKDILTLLCAATIPIALGIYTVITYQQQPDHAQQARQFDLQQSIEMRQKTLFDKFLTNLYNLDNDSYLEEEEKPWAFANAYYRAAHRRWDATRKGDALQFLKEKKLIDRANCSSKCAEKKVDDIIRLSELNFDLVNPRSATGELNRLNLGCVVFDRVSMTGATFSFTSLDGTSFDGGRLKNTRFNHASLMCASFNGTNFDGTDFSNSNLQGARFVNVDLSRVKLTQDQINQASFDNTIMPNGKMSDTTTSTTTVVTTTSTTTTISPTSTTVEISMTSAVRRESGWTVTGNMTYPRTRHTASVLSGGRVLVTGSESDSSSNTAELYDPSTELWVVAAYMTYPRWYHTASVLSDGRVLVTGSQADISAYTSELYQP